MNISLNFKCLTLLLLTIVTVLLILTTFKNDNTIFVSIENQEIRIKHHLTPVENIIVVYNKNRNNDTFDMSQFILQDKNADEDDFTGEIVMSSATDFVSPYGLLAKNNTVNDKAFTVGGAHATEGTDGYPTSRFGEFEYIKLDNEIIEQDGFYKGKQLNLKVTHYVFASNTIDKEDTRDSLLEERFYEITNQNHNIQVKMTALEDIILTRYAGLQMTQPEFYDYFYFSSGSNRYSIQNEPKGLYTLNERSYDKLDKAILYNDKSMLIMKTDRNYGIGTGEFAPKSTSDNPQSALTYTGGKFGKIYSHNLGKNNNRLNLTLGESIKYRGAYQFKENNYVNQLIHLH